jgi:hypothetical protein
MEIEPSFRASDADRERFAQRLRHATAEGRLTSDEFEARLEAAYAARTVRQLDSLVADLPATTAVTRSRIPIAGLAGVASIVTVVFAALGALVMIRGHSASAIVGGPHPGVLNMTGPPPDLQQDVIAAASLIVLFVAMAACAALVVGWIRRSSQHL